LQRENFRIKTKRSKRGFQSNTRGARQGLRELRFARREERRKIVSVQNRGKGKKKKEIIRIGERKKGFRLFGAEEKGKRSFLWDAKRGSFWLK